MRPTLLNPLFADISGIKGVGPKLAALFTNLTRPSASKAESARVIDLLLHLPSAIVDRRHRCRISQLPVQGIVTVEVRIGKHRPPPPGNKRLPYRIEVYDDTGAMTLSYFKAFPDHLKRLLPEGEVRFVSGEISWFSATPQLSHPDHVLTAEAFADMPLIEAVYPLTAGLSSRVVSKAVSASLAKLPALPEWQDTAWLAKNAWPSFNEALKRQHTPTAVDAVDKLDVSRMRLAYDELLANQLALAMVRRSMKRAKGRSLPGTSKIQEAILQTLPFALTSSQKFALAEISADLASSDRTLRLLQGDVGSGKTVVALLTMAQAVESGVQAALMAPTEILARQHLATLEKLAGSSGLRFALLTGREKGKTRQEVLDALASGDIDILIGTHALFQEGVTFRDLGVAVIDEQHRFGVHQRLALQAKSENAVDLLVMTATPIPRTLALTVYGDMDVSKLTEKPAGRKPVDTRVIPMSRLEEVLAGVKRGVEAGARAYWVCPLVEESDLVDMSAAEGRFQSLKDIFPGKAGLVHGKLKGAEKDAVMAQFKSGAISVLVATTVIEVGVDVPEASIMVIENAERFGLAQLHQLRGRVGRGSASSNCVLLYQEPLGEIAKARLSIMRETEDGFRIAEEDLKLRGAGEMLGTLQSGIPLFRLADLSVHGELLAAAKDDASLVMTRDPSLKSLRGENLRHLLYLFERDEAIRLLAAG
jgi:ATP-dependent DNA helicase RecG